MRRRCRGFWSCGCFDFKRLRLRENKKDGESSAKTQQDEYGTEDKKQEQELESKRRRTTDDGRRTQDQFLETNSSRPILGV